MKIAVVHDWLITYSGAERVLEQILACFPQTDLFAVVDFFDDKQRVHLQNKKAVTTFIQKFPLAKKLCQAYLPFMPLAIEQLDLSKYDVIISNSHAVAKGVITGPDQLHISYVNSPIRYAWDLQHQYLKEAGLSTGLRSYIVRKTLHKMRIWDLRTANGVDCFVANSNFIAKRIWKVYRREAAVIYPPVDTNYFIPAIEKKDDFYLTVSRLTPYKKVGLIVKAFAKLPQQKLVVIGDGSQRQSIQKHITPNITFLGQQPTSVIKEYMQRAKAFVFAAEEDFGITPLEAQACGTPVIAYGKGGCLETICDVGVDVGNIGNKNSTGIFFTEQTEDSLLAAIEKFESLSIDPKNCRDNALRFSEEVFKVKFKEFVEKEIGRFFGKI